MGEKTIGESGEKVKNRLWTDGNGQNNFLIFFQKYVIDLPLFDIEN